MSYGIVIFEQYKAQADRMHDTLRLASYECVIVTKFLNKAEYIATTAEMQFPARPYVILANIENLDRKIAIPLEFWPSECFYIFYGTSPAFPTSYEFVLCDYSYFQLPEGRYTNKSTVWDKKLARILIKLFQDDNIKINN